MLSTSASTCSRLLKKPIFHPPSPGAPRRAFPRFSFWVRQNPQRDHGRLTDSAARTDVVLLIRRTLRPEGTPPVSTRLRPRRMAFLSSLLYLKQFPLTFSAVSLHQTQRMAMLSQAPEDGHVDV